VSVKYAFLFYFCRPKRDSLKKNASEAGADVTQPEPEES